MKRFARALYSMVAIFGAAFAVPLWAEEGAVLRYSDGSPSLRDLAAINRVLITVGVRLSRVEIPATARPLLEASAKAPLSHEQKQRLLELFSLTRDQVLAEVRAAGRRPVIAGGGSLTSGEADVPPYPKVYDLRAMQPQDRINARDKFARLHVNSADDGTGVDEVMTLVAGGPWKWYFLLRDNTVAELHMSRVAASGPGWRLSYPGLTPHGGHFHADDGLVIAYITGPSTWTMRYQAPGIAGVRMLGKNPWIDFNVR